MQGVEYSQSVQDFDEEADQDQQLSQHSHQNQHSGFNSQAHSYHSKSQSNSQNSSKHNSPVLSDQNYNPDQLQKQQDEEIKESYHQKPQEQEEDNQFYFELGEHVDCLDTMNKWLNAEIVAKRGNMVKIHFTGWSYNYDDWLDQTSHRLLKQWSRLKPITSLKLFNRLDVRDVKGKWLEANIVDVEDLQSDNNLICRRIQVHFKGWSKKWDETILIDCQSIHDLLDSKIAEIGMYSGAYGRAKFDKSMRQKSKSKLGQNLSEMDLNKKSHAIVNQQNQNDQQNDEDDDQDLDELDDEAIKQKIREIKEKENQFRREMAMKNLKIVEMEGDGNCLFRAISDQIYDGDQSHHNLIRQACLDYISLEREFFSQFIIGGLDNFDMYVHWKRQDAVWGDDIELQAISEIYNRPIEIYAYRAEPMRTFHEDEHRGRGTKPIRLSYHGNKHYNSITEINPSSSIQSQRNLNMHQEEEKISQNQMQQQQKKAQKLQPGQLEDQALMMSQRRKQLLDSQSHNNQNQQKSNMINTSSSSNTHQNHDIVSDLIMRSRKDFEQQGKRDMEVALAESMQNYEKDIKDKEQQLINQTENQYDEEQLMQLALKESIKDEDLVYMQQQQQQFDIYEDHGAGADEDEEEMLQKALAMSTVQVNNNNQQEFVQQQNNTDLQYEEIIRIALEYGFDAEQAVEAISIVGTSNPDLVINYLLSSNQQYF
eukprot:403369422